MATPYRDEERALRQRLAALDAQLRNARALDEKRRALDEARERLEAERVEVAERLAGLNETFSLEGLRIASPCKADWNAMAGDERVRFCGQCQKNVYNLSDMSRDEAEALVQGAEGRLCVRMYRRADGTVLTSDCPEGALRKQRRRRLALFTGSGALATASAFGYVSMTTMGGSASQGQVLMGTPPAIDTPIEVPTQVDPAPAMRVEMGEAPALMGDIAIDPPPQKRAGHAQPKRAIMGKPEAPAPKSGPSGATGKGQSVVK
jgi:hypothetical protein